MTTRETQYVAGLPLTTWIALASLIITVAAFGGKMYANDAVQSEKIKRLKEDANNTQLLVRQNQELLGKIWTEVVIIKADVSQAK